MNTERENPRSAAHGRDRKPDEDGKRPGSKIPQRPDDTTPGGDAKNDTGEDNQRQKDGEQSADDFIRP